MRPTLILFSLLLGLFTAAPAQDCLKYFPSEEGTALVMQHYNKRDKKTGVTTQTLVEKKQKAGKLHVKMRNAFQPEDGDSSYVTEYTITCQDGNMYVDMNSYLNQQQMSAYQTMDVEVTADALEMPADLSVGQTLNNGNVTAKVSSNGVQVATLSVDLTDRKVEAKEKVKTPAGTYECYKITYNTLTKVGFVKVQTQGAEWYAPDVGAVKTASYNKRGKLTSYSLLTEIDK